MGLFHFLKELSYPRIFIYLAIPFFLNSIIFGFKGDIGSAIRCILPLFVFIVPSFLQSNLNKDGYIKLAKGVVYFFVCIYLLEFFLVNQTMKQVLPGVFIPKFEGASGYSNFSGFYMGIIGLVFLHSKKYKWFFFSILLQLLTFSRSSFLMTALAIFGCIIYFKENKFSKKLSHVFLILILISPFLLYLVEWTLNDHLKMKLVFLTSGRYPIQHSFLEMFLDNPFGVGYLQSHKLFHLYRETGTSIIENGLYQIPFRDIDAHSTFVQFLVEFGFVGYMILIYTLTKIYNSIISESFILGWFFCCILFCQLFLYGLNEFLFFYFLAYAIPHSKLGQMSFKKLNILASLSFKKES
jgi:hypothetical protein